MTEKDEAVTREEMHHRRIEMRGYRRSDGLFEIEGSVVDRKPHEFRAPNGDRLVPAGGAVHDISVRLIIDADMVIRDVSTSMAAVPYPDCHGAGQVLDGLKGMRIGSGWMSEVRRRLGGPQGCTHMMELLGPMATAAYQSLVAVRMTRPEVVNAQGRPVKVDSCYAYASHRQLVRRRWPEHYTGAETKGGKASE